MGLLTGRPPASGVVGGNNLSFMAAMKASSRGEVSEALCELFGYAHAIALSHWSSGVHTDGDQQPRQSSLDWPRGLDTAGTMSNCRQFAALGVLCRAPEYGNQHRREKTASPPSGPREKHREKERPCLLTRVLRRLLFESRAGVRGSRSPQPRVNVCRSSC